MRLPFWTRHGSVLNPSILIINSGPAELPVFAHKWISRRDGLGPRGMREHRTALRAFASPEPGPAAWPPIRLPGNPISLSQGSSVSSLIFTSKCILLIVRLVVLEESLVLNLLPLWSGQSRKVARHHVSQKSATTPQSSKSPPAFSARARPVGIVLSER